MKMSVRNKAAHTDVVTPLEERNRHIAYKAALEGIVLLENDGCLPIRPGNIALYGAGAGMTIKGGTGSGEVNERHAVTILEGLEEAGFTVTPRIGSGPMRHCIGQEKKPMRQSFDVKSYI